MLRPKYALLLLGVVALSGLVWWAVRDETSLATHGAGSHTTQSSAPSVEPALRPWPMTDAAQSWTVAPGAEGLRAVREGVDVSVPITPLLVGTGPVRWTRVDKPNRLEWQGRASLVITEDEEHRGQVTYRWFFDQGNPQATLVWSVEWTTDPPRSQNIRAELVLPDGEVQAQSPEIRPVSIAPEGGVTPVMPDQLRWLRDGESWEWAAPSADGALLRSRDQAVVWEVQFHASDNERGPACGQTQGTAIAWRGEVFLRLGTPAMPVVSLHPSGALATAVPVFREPKEADGMGQYDGDLEEKVARYAALLFGHSDPADPRYTNGGLLGAGLGASVEIPDALVGTEPFNALVRQSKNRPIEWLHTTDLSPESQTVLVTDCNDLAGGIRAQHRVHFLASDDSPEAFRSRWFGVHGARTSSMTAERVPVDWLRTTHRNPSESLQDWVSRRAFHVFSVPLIATRNPLLPAYRNRLLRPERQGHWAIEEEFARLLTEIEMRTEIDGWHWTSVRDASVFLAGRRNVELTWLPGGQLETTSTDEVRGLTLVIGGTPSVDIAEGRLGGRKIRETMEAPRTWLWFDATAGSVTRVDLGNSPPDPIYWQ